jgi:hypothetical protein
MSLLLTGDDVARNSGELADSIQNPWSASAIQHAMAAAYNSGLVVGVDMVDEVGSFWGNTPIPTDGRWMKKSPPLPDTSFVQLMTIMNAAPRPAVTWPISAISADADAANWMGNPQFADYATLYWDKLDWRNAYPSGPSFPQVQAGQERATIGRLAVLQRDKPMLMEMSVTGPFYVKLGPGDGFVVGQDQLQSGGWLRPELCSAQAMLAVATGMAGVRAYAFDSAAWKASRVRAKIGQGNLQTGAEPFQTGTDRWNAMSAAFNLIQELEPFLLQPKINALNLGANIVTAARQGPNSRVFMAINFSESDSTVPLDLTPYFYDGASTVKVYRLLGGSRSSATTAYPAAGGTLIHAGETIVWLFQPNSTAAALEPSVVIASPGVDSLVSGVVPVAASLVDTDQAAALDLLVDGTLIGTTTDSLQLLWDSSLVQQDASHTLTVISHFPDGTTAQASITVWVGTEALS